MPAQWTVADRLALVIKDAVIAILPAVLAICIVAAQRLNPSLFVGRTPKPNSAVDINNRFILNTVEQFILYFIGNAGIALYCPPEEARTLVILTMLFVMGRVLFWVGYHYNPHLRAFGFGITFYPTVTVYLWLILYMVFGIHVKQRRFTSYDRHQRNVVSGRPNDYDYTSSYFQPRHRQVGVMSLQIFKSYPLKKF